MKTMTTMKSTFLLPPLLLLSTNPHMLSHAFHPLLRPSCRSHANSRLSSSSLPPSPLPPSSSSASTTPQLLHALWDLLSASSTMQRGDSLTLLVPNMVPQLNGPYLSKLMGHLDACRDVCDDFGTNTLLSPHLADGHVEGFTISSYRNPNAVGTLVDMNFGPDPLWDEDEIWDFSGADDPIPDFEITTPRSDGVIEAASKEWVDAMMADMALCPFTQSSSRSGIPPGPVRYRIDRVTTAEEAYARYWSEACLIEATPEAQLSTTLQILPEFCIGSVESFEQWADTLTGTLEALGMEETLQLIFFHPNWTFRDGGERSGEGEPANYARRSPWPMVNLLRTGMVRTAQRGIPTGLVYRQNEKTLLRIGTSQLESMLRNRDWTQIRGIKVDRKDMEAHRVAQHLQVHGAVRSEDTSFLHDSTPAANRVDRAQIDRGNMVNVIRQALEIRLGKGGEWRRLDGARTSAALMAADFLVEELNRIAEGGAGLYGFEDEEDYSGLGVEDAEVEAMFGGGMLMSDPEEENPRGVDLIGRF